MPSFCPCGKSATYGKIGFSPVTCAKCVTDKTMINLRMVYCEYDGCRICASYGPATSLSRRSLRCAMHKLPGDVLKSGRPCEVCGRSSSYGYKYPSRCFTHKEPGQERIFKSSWCKCGSLAYWREKFIDGMPGKARHATHCTKCKTDNMECTIARGTCITPGCTKRRKFIQSISNDFCPAHLDDRPALQCVTWPCDKLIISSYDKCRKHRKRTYTDAYNPCKQPVQSIDLKDVDLKDVGLKDVGLKDVSLKDNQLTDLKDVKYLNASANKTLKTQLSIWLNL